MSAEEIERRQKEIADCQRLHWKAGHKHECAQWVAGAAKAAEAVEAAAAAEAVEREAKEEEEKARKNPNTRTCSVCGRHLSSDAFSKSQWKKGATRACENCKSSSS